MKDDLLYFNGIDGVSGEYLLAPMTPTDFWRKAKTKTRWAASRAQELSWLSERHNRNTQERPAWSGGACPLVKCKRTVRHRLGTDLPQGCCPKIGGEDS